MKENRFVVYRLQKLAILLRILGFDVLHFQDDYISVINLTKREYRILLSRVKFLRKLPWIFYL
ncbi:Mut7-C RNAse domain-containing protein, partial [bacterium]|nr:Mut7-C RNAse domain-containing protein [bacterium]